MLGMSVILQLIDFLVLKYNKFSNIVWIQYSETDKQTCVHALGNTVNKETEVSGGDRFKKNGQFID